VTTGGTSSTFACIPGCYPPPALSNYNSATDLQLKGQSVDSIVPWPPAAVGIARQNPPGEQDGEQAGSDLKPRRAKSSD
jgi:hypothetical protein